MKNLLVVALSFTIVLSCYAQDENFVFTNKKGKVTFNHTAHKAKVASCDSCHPDIPEKFDDSVSIMKQGHGVCKTCHISMAAGPTTCDGCHVK